MEIKQISVFLENTTGRISEVTKALAQAGINLRAISIADTADFGILRLIVDKTEEAVNALSDAGFTTSRLTSVAAVEIDDEPGSLARVMELFEKAQVNIEYLYASLEGKAGKAVVIFKLEDHDKGFKILKENGLTMAERF
ncbi:amino acid-binding protein [Spirochaetia bacterium]|nr:amino acid-binding protein [Spirochaetia bacterium]